MVLVSKDIGLLRRPLNLQMTGFLWLPTSADVGRLDYTGNLLVPYICTNVAHPGQLHPYLTNDISTIQGKILSPPRDDNHALLCS
jgi:hypothetical protein